MYLAVRTPPHHAEENLCVISRIGRVWLRDKRGGVYYKNGSTYKEIGIKSVFLGLHSLFIIVKMIEQVRPGFRSGFYLRRNLSRIKTLCINLAREKSHAQRNCSSGDDDNTGITPISYMFRPLSRHDDFPVLCGGPPVA